MIREVIRRTQAHSGAIRLEAELALLLMIREVIRRTQAHSGAIRLEAELTLLLMMRARA
jgi:hypothetical protein